MDTIKKEFAGGVLISAEFADGVTMEATVHDDLEGLDALADMEQVRKSRAIRTRKNGEPWGWEYLPMDMMAR